MSFTVSPPWRGLSAENLDFLMMKDHAHPISQKQRDIVVNPDCHINFHSYVSSLVH